MKQTKYRKPRAKREPSFKTKLRQTCKALQKFAIEELQNKPGPTENAQGEAYYKTEVYDGPASLPHKGYHVRQARLQFRITAIQLALLSEDLLDLNNKLVYAIACAFGRGSAHECHRRNFLCMTIAAVRCVMDGTLTAKEVTEALMTPRTLSPCHTHIKEREAHIKIRQRFDMALSEYARTINPLIPL